MSIVARDGPLDDLLPRYRGCSGLSSPAVQALERAVFAELGWSLFDMARSGAGSPGGTGGAPRGKTGAGDALRGDGARGRGRSCARLRSAVELSRTRPSRSFAVEGLRDARVSVRPVKLATVRTETARAPRVSKATACSFFRWLTSERSSPARASRPPARLTPSAELALAEASFAPLVPRPEKVFCVGMNYKAHIAELGQRTAGLPDVVREVRLEPHRCPRRPCPCLGEQGRRLGGRTGRRHRKPPVACDAEQARAAIAGFTVVNDISMRDWQNRTSQFLQGKAFDASTPVGPYLVTGDEIGDAADLELRCEVDGVVMQSGRTSDLLFGPAGRRELHQPVRRPRAGRPHLDRHPLRGRGVPQASRVPRAGPGRGHDGGGDRQLCQPLPGGVDLMSA